MKTHEIFARGLIRVFGAVFLHILLEAEYLDGPQNGAFEVERCGRAVSSALWGCTGAQPAAGLQRETSGRLRKEERRKARGRERLVDTAEEFLGSSAQAVATCLQINEINKYACVVRDGIYIELQNRGSAHVGSHPLFLQEKTVTLTKQS